MDTVVRPRHSLEELVDRLMDALVQRTRRRRRFPRQRQRRAWPGAIHEARRMRQARDLDGALAVLAEMDTARGGDEAGSVGLRRVEAVGKEAVRRPRGHWSTARAPAGPSR